jgi:hypothetical protein
MAQASVHSQMRRRRSESNKDVTFKLTCFPLLQDTWLWLLCTLKCCSGAEILTKMALAQTHACYFCRTRGPGFCTLSNAAQAQRVLQRWRCQTHMFSISSGQVALASVHSKMVRRRRESTKYGAVAITCFLFHQDMLLWVLCTIKNCACAESPTKMELSH